MSVQSRQRMSIHGGNHEDQQLDLNGMDVGDAFSQGANLAFFPDTNMEEMQFQFSGNAAEIETGGVRINMIPKEGGNRFNGQSFATGTWPALQANNLDSTLEADGLRDPTVVDQVWGFTGNLGGPIVKDKLWFFAAHTTQRAFIFPTGIYNGTTPGALVFTSDFNSRSLDTSTANEQGINLTWQATAKDKVRFYYTNSFTDQDVYLQGRTLGTIFIAPDGAIVSNIDTNTYQVNWSRPHTNRLLFEAGYSKHPIRWKFDPAAGALVDLPGILQLGPTIAHRNMAGWLSGATDRDSPKDIQMVRGSASYVTGRHNFKFGGSFVRQWTTTIQNSGTNNGNWTSYVVSGGTPVQAQFWGSSSGDQFRDDPGALRAGSVEPGPADGQRRRALRQPAHGLPRSGPSADEVGDAGVPDSGQDPRLLVRHPAKAWRGLRPLRHRQDGAQGVNQPVRQARIDRLGPVDQPRHRQPSDEPHVHRQRVHRHHRRVHRR